MKVSVTIDEVINLVRQKVHAENDDDFSVEFIEQPISSVETWGGLPWYKDDSWKTWGNVLFEKLDPDVREAVGYTTTYDLKEHESVDKFLSGQISWDVYNRFVKAAKECRIKADYTYFHAVITAVEIDEDNVTRPTAARYLRCSDSHVTNLLKKGILQYIPETKSIAAADLIRFRGGKYIDGHLENNKGEL